MAKRIVYMFHEAGRVDTNMWDSVYANLDDLEERIREEFGRRVAISEKEDYLQVSLTVGGSEASLGYIAVIPVVGEFPSTPPTVIEEESAFEEPNAPEEPNAEEPNAAEELSAAVENPQYSNGKMKQREYIRWAINQLDIKTQKEAWERRNEIATLFLQGVRSSVINIKSTKIASANNEDIQRYAVDILRDGLNKKAYLPNTIR